MRRLLFLLTGCLFAQSAGAQVNAGLLGRFPFDNNTADALGNMGVNSATNAGFGPDARNQANAALRLGGNGEVWILPNGLLSFGTTGDFSFSVAFRSLGSSTQAFFTNQGYYTATGTGARGWSLGFDNARVGKVYLGLVAASSPNGALGLATQASFNDGLWHTAAAVVNRGTREIRVYVDGAAQPLTYVSPRPNYGTVSGSVFTLDATAAMFVDLNPGFSTSTTGFLVEANRFGLGLNGSLDEARFYNRALAASEVQALNAQVLAAAPARAAGAGVQCFPNPARDGQLRVRWAQPLAPVAGSFYTALGQRVAPTVTAATDTEWQVTGLAPGLYWLTAQVNGARVRQSFQVK
ncbi:LamG domain-containing protein [Hymenobacter ruricola]|uniref:T9SS type A sorting domain-containing protein n=1 Tax=Hymenobacter ruricola TaxID=2791023 RepID=A0ABS0IBD2_9BACT|nr:LamG-like jellyroll fold domain-containing protein [Hymenobacter ruricola]MBF9224265.1 hypothetical protein [Hymenobacter ruricola]